MDEGTVGFYDREASGYAGYAAGGRGPWLERFAGMLPAGGRVLDLGSGSGWASARFRDLGFEVEAMDASAGLAAEALTRYGLTVRVATFGDLDAVARFDGVWAAFSLLHDTREAMPGNLARIVRALLPGGALYVGLKAGEGAHRDRLGRLYTYYTADELRGLLTAAGFADHDISPTEGTAYDGEPTAYLHAFARLG